MSEPTNGNAPDQRPVGEQLHELMALATARGLYAAADWILDVVRIASEGAGANMPPTKSDTKERRCIQTVNRFGYPLPPDVAHDNETHGPADHHSGLAPQDCEHHDYLPEPEPATERTRTQPSMVTCAVCKEEVQLGTELHAWPDGGGWHRVEVKREPAPAAESEERCVRCEQPEDSPVHEACTCDYRGVALHAFVPPAPAAESERTEGRLRRWYLGAMNDGLFIIDTPPRPSTDDAWHDRPNGPTTVLNVVALTEAQAQAIVDAHNSGLTARTPPAAEQSGTPNHVCGLQGFGRQDDVCPACQTPAVEQSAEGEGDARDREYELTAYPTRSRAGAFRGGWRAGIAYKRNRAKGGE